MESTCEGLFVTSRAVWVGGLGFWAGEVWGDSGLGSRIRTPGRVKGSGLKNVDLRVRTIEES